MRKRTSTLNSMYTLDCDYYSKTFTSIDALLNDIIETGMDPNYHIIHIKDNIKENTYQTAAELIVL